ncbi:hypothetical protein AC1031_005786 [Aphanomyces cochlioides]|nr:hypothetical protein AC1031_005786 [Aphanomyces cochlioides]
MSARVEKLLELGRATTAPYGFVDAGLDRLSQEDRQARGVAVPSAAPALAALPPNPKNTSWMFHSAGSANRKDEYFVANLECIFVLSSLLIGIFRLPLLGQGYVVLNLENN